MARPKIINFYEVPLPQNLPDAKKWLYEYHHRSKDLVDYISAQGAGETMYYGTISCLTKLRAFLLNNEKEYSNEHALQWFEKTGPYPQGYKIALSRLMDLYLYGNIQPVHEFPHAVPYKKNLLEPWLSILVGFMNTLVLKDISLKQIKKCVSRFFYKIQKQNIMSPSDITYDVLEAYFVSDGHVSAGTYALYTYSVGDVLLYMAANGLCSPGLGWYPYFRMHKRIVKITDFAADQVNRLYSLKCTKDSMPLCSLNASIQKFLEKFKSYGYSPSPFRMARYTLYNILLFIDMHKLSYSKDLAMIWLEHEKTFHENSKSWKVNRKILHMFDDFINNGILNPYVIYREKPLLSDSLPTWCRLEMDTYLGLKSREGWQNSTLDMIRSSVTRFCKYLVSINFTSFSQITPATLKDFNIDDQHSSAEGKNAYNGRIRKFIQFLERKGIVRYGISNALLYKAAPREKIVVVLTDEEKEAIKTKLKLCASPMELRDKAIMLLGTRMGLRSIDIVGINLTDIDWKEQTLQIIQKKTDHEIILPIPTDVANAIYIYISKGRPNQKTTSKKLFIKHRVPYDNVSRNACKAALKRTLPGRNVPGSSFHVTRKTYATTKLNNGVGKQGVADLLGHKDAGTLTPYLLLDNERMRMCSISLSEACLQLEGGYYGRI